MALIFYSVAGEGRGHATRARAVVDHLCREHRVMLFASHDAFQLLAPCYAGARNVQVCRIPGPRFAYDSHRKLNYLKTAWSNLCNIGRLYRWIHILARKLRTMKPDLLISDFEPLLPRAAAMCKLPFVSLSHQHFLIVNDLSRLPRWLRWHAAGMGLFVRGYVRGQSETIVSSFYNAPLKASYEHVKRVGVLLRRDIVEMRPERQDHLLVYMRRFAPPNVLEALQNSGHEVRVYGLGERPRDGNLIYRPVSENGFLQDLGTCRALVTSAGNQLVGEALYLRKPVLALPEDNNHEQYINGFFLNWSGMGQWAEPSEVDRALLDRFLGRSDEFIEKIDPDVLNGLPATLESIRHLLNRH